MLDVTFQFTDLVFCSKSYTLIATGERVVRFCAAHPTGTMDFPLGETAALPPRPCINIRIPANTAEDSLLPVNGALALLAEISLISFHTLSLLDSSSRLKEWSRKNLLQATYLTGEKVLVFHKMVQLLHLLFSMINERR